MTDAKQWLPLVKRIAKRHSRKCDLDRDELYSYGMLGLAKALDSFDESRGVPMAAYITRKVNWAILDGMRALIEQNVTMRSDELGDTESNYEAPDAAYENKQAFMDAMSCVSKQERKLILLYLQHGSDTEVGHQVGINKSWACRERIRITAKMTG